MSFAVGTKKVDNLNYPMQPLRELCTSTQIKVQMKDALIILDVSPLFKTEKF